jgi:hypothetical protein
MKTKAGPGKRGCLSEINDLSKLALVWKQRQTSAKQMRQLTRNEMWAKSS